MKKKVLISGGQGDIAKSIKELLIQNDYDVKAPSRLEMDVTDWKQIEDVISQYRPDILINNAGYVVPGSIRNADPERARKHIEINLGGVFYCAEIGLKYNPDLCIINIASAAAVEVHGTWSEYCASKAAVVMATKCWAEDNIYAVAVSPGRTRTKMRKSLYPLEDQNTLLEPDDFAQIVLRAAEKKYEPGSHIIVKKQNVKQLLEESL